MPADALAPKGASASAGMVLNPKPGTASKELNASNDLMNLMTYSVGISWVQTISNPCTPTYSAVNW